MTIIVSSFVFFLLSFVVIGVSSALYSKKTNKDYLLAGRNVAPSLAALSAAATNNSGYMFIGLIGYTYMQGLSSMWILVGWILGDMIASFIIHRKLRVMAERRDVLSFVGVISQWDGTEYYKLRFLGGVIIILFLGAYAGAQMNAGSKALHVIFGWDYSVGAIIGALIIIAYCYSGGIRAAIWTDAAQSLVMLVAMLLLFVVGINELGGIQATISKLYAISPTYMNLFPSDLPIIGIFGIIVFVASWIVMGYVVIGQPHIMIRFMAVDTPQDIGRVRVYYYTWYIVFSILSVSVGLISRLLFSSDSILDAELALPNLSLALLPDVLVGLVLAAIFAASMSTADSQIMSCSASLTRDMFLHKLIKGKRASYLFTKLATLIVTLIALFIALFGSNSVFHLVILAWTVLGASFAPLLTVYVFGGRPSERVVLSMVISGLLVLFVWRMVGLSDVILEIVPSLATSFLVYFLYRIFGSPSDRSSVSDDIIRKEV